MEGAVVVKDDEFKYHEVKRRRSGGVSVKISLQQEASSKRLTKWH